MLDEMDKVKMGCDEKLTTEGLDIEMEDFDDNKNKEEGFGGFDNQDEVEEMESSDEEVSSPALIAQDLDRNVTTTTTTTTTTGEIAVEAS